MVNIFRDLLTLNNGNVTVVSPTNYAFLNSSSTTTDFVPMHSNALEENDKYNNVILLKYSPANHTLRKNNDSKSKSK